MVFMWKVIVKHSYLTLLFAYTTLLLSVVEIRALQMSFFIIPDQNFRIYTECMTLLSCYFHHGKHPTFIKMQHTIFFISSSFSREHTYEYKTYINMKPLFLLIHRNLLHVCRKPRIHLHSLLFVIFLLLAVIFASLSNYVFCNTGQLDRKIQHNSLIFHSTTFSMIHCDIFTYQQTYHSTHHVAKCQDAMTVI